MDWLTIFLVYVMNIRSEGDLIMVQRIFLLENDFWCADQEIKTDKGYLYKVVIKVERKGVFTAGFDYYSESFYSLKATNLGYLVLGYSMMEEEEYIKSFLKSPEIDKFSWKLCFLFMNKPLESFFISRYFDFKKQEYVTYKLPEKTSNNSLILRCDVSNGIRLKHIKERFEGFIELKLLKFNEYIEKISKKKIEEKKTSKFEDDADFDLYYFENYSKCLENFKKLFKDLCYFNLLKDNFFDSFTDMFSKMFIDKTTTLKVSQFKERLCKKFHEKLRKHNEAVKTWKPLLDGCCDYLKDEMLMNNLFLLIGGKYDVDYYIEQLSKIIYESEKQMKLITSSCKDEDFIILSGIADSLKDGLEKLQFSAMKDFYEFEYVHKHFCKLLKRNVETLDDFCKLLKRNVETLDDFCKLLKRNVETLDDYKTLEKIVCDYYNMFVYIVNLYHELYKKDTDSRVTYSYFPPIYIDNYNLRIIDGIKIDFMFLNQCGQIRGFDYEGKEVLMVEDTDYFIDEFNVLYCPSDVLKMKNIQEIEIISSEDEKDNKRFKVNEYLST